MAVLLPIVVIATALMANMSGSSKSAPKLTHTVTRGNLVVTVTELGTLESSNNQEIKCKVRGFSVVTSVISGGSEVEEGDELVRLGTKRIEDEIGKYTTDAHMARATFERTKADAENANIAIDAYLKGTYRSQLKALEKQLTIANANLQTAEKMLEHSKAMFKRGYISELEVDGNRFTVTQAKLEQKVRKNAIDVLNKYTKEMQLETMRGSYAYLSTKLKADEAGLRMDEGRRDRAKTELDYCVIKADRPGLVIYPSAAAWKDTPDVAEGVSVRKDQVLLLMPDLTKMQVNIGIHESLVDRIKAGMIARVSLPDMHLEGKVSKVARIARPAGWWTGDVVKYDTIINLPQTDGLKPGMSAEVEVIMAEHEEVLTVPIAAVVETENEKLCWVKSGSGIQRRTLRLGDNNEIFIIVKSGLKAGDEVVLNPLAHVDDAQAEALRTMEAAKSEVEPGAGENDMPPSDATSSLLDLPWGDVAVSAAGEDDVVGPSRPDAETRHAS